MKAIIGLGEIRELLKTDKAIKILCAAGAALILLTALGGLFGGLSSGVKSSSGKDTQLVSAGVTEYERLLEQRLADILSDIEGVGEARVMVTLDTSGETEYGRNADMLLSVTAPTVRGVIVVCDGGDSITVKEKVINAVSGVFGINTLHISVAAKK